MEYKGKLYGKVGKSYFPLLENTEDVDKRKKQIDYLVNIILDDDLDDDERLSLLNNKALDIKFQDMKYSKKDKLNISDVGKRLLSELRKHYLIEVNIDTGMPKADINTIMNIWNEVNEYLRVKTIVNS